MMVRKLFGIFCTLVLLSGCAAPKPGETSKRGIPRTVAVLPCANRTQDEGTPYLIRYFLEKELKSKGFHLPNSMGEVNEELRQMGITDGNQIESSSFQHIGQFLKVDGIVHAVLLDSRQQGQDFRKLLRVQFRLVSVQNGRVLWEKEVETEGKSTKAIPIVGIVTSEWSPDLVKTIAQSPAGKLPRSAVRQALGSLHR